MSLYQKTPAYTSIGETFSDHTLRDHEVSNPGGIHLYNIIKKKSC